MDNEINSKIDNKITRKLLVFGFWSLVGAETTGLTGSETELMTG